MLFNSYIFLFVFLPLLWGGFRFLSSKHWISLATWWLLIGSGIFYAYWNPPFILLLLGSITFNFILGKQFLNRSRYSKIWLVLGIVGNLGVLAYFKYWNFFINNINDLFGCYFQTITVFLPLGISFFTFQQITYIIDIYKGRSQPEEQFLFYALYIFFFPHLIAGPIVHHKILIPQLRTIRMFALNWKNISEGLALLAIGLFKKVVIADSLSPWVKAVFDSQESYTFTMAWIGALAYTLQIYFDFSGYSDMAMGLARLFNIKFPVNFHSPYKSSSIIEFWRRWHMTLSFFLRDYLYIALGGNRRGKLVKFRNILMTMLLGGLWHGAGWTFIIWGLFHGIFICINHIWRSLSNYLQIKIPTWMAWSITFISIIVCWVFFRASSISQAMALLNAMVMIPHSFSEVVQQSKKIEVIAFLILACLILPESWEWLSFKQEKRTYYKMLVCFIMMIVSVLMISSTPSEFLYFQF